MCMIFIVLGHSWDKLRTERPTVSNKCTGGNPVFGKVRGFHCLQRVLNQLKSSI